MRTYVRTDKCDGCEGQEQTACMYICPHDLMALDLDGSATGHAMKAYNQEPEQCAARRLPAALAALSSAPAASTLWLVALTGASGRSLR